MNIFLVNFEPSLKQANFTVINQSFCKESFEKMDIWQNERKDAFCAVSGSSMVAPVIYLVIQQTSFILKNIIEINKYFILR